MVHLPYARYSPQQTLYVGISAVFSDLHTAIVAIAIHDITYLLDFSVHDVELNGRLDIEDDPIADHIIKQLENYERETASKFIGAGLPHGLLKRSPRLCSRLWLDLDIVPITIKPDENSDDDNVKDFWAHKCVDEQADSMARKCIM